MQKTNKQNILPLQDDVLDEFRRTFNYLSEEELHVIFSNNSDKFFSKGTDVYRQNSRINGCYFVYSGIIKVFKTGTEGKEQIIRFAKRGDLIAFRSVINKELACTSAKAVDNSVLYYIPSSTLINLLKSNPEFSYHMIRITCKELEESNCYITDIAQKSVKERLAEVLDMLINDFGLDNDKILQIAITREELANMVGTATESVIRLLSEFKTEKILESQGRKLRILNQNKLSEIAKTY
jgi:CRP-like cAMP-binding protein